MGEVPLNLSRWDDTVIPRRLTTIESKLGAVEFQLHLIYELFKPSNIGGGEEVPAPLIVRLEMPTGSKFELPDNFNNWSGQNWIRDRLDSDLGVDGHKFFTFNSFDLPTSLNGGYNFTVDIDSAFTSVDTTTTPYIQCYLLNPVKLAKIALQLFGGWSDDYLGSFPDNLVGWIKKGNWAGQLSTTPDEINLKPNLLSWVGFFSVKVQGEGWKSAVIDYEEASNKFIILGY